MWALGVKEVWEVPKPLTKVIHTLGWPLRTAAKYKRVRRLVDLPDGRGQGLDRVRGRPRLRRRELSVHDILQQFKTHPRIRGILEGGKRIAWGAKAIPEGGYWAMPKLTRPGAVICGDAGGMVNVPELKGIHYAMHSGSSPPSTSTGAQGGLDRLLEPTTTPSHDSVDRQGHVPHAAT